MRTATAEGTQITFNLALRSDPANAAIAKRFTDLVAQASAARMQNDVPRAIDLYSQALQQNPKWADGWWFLGSLQYGAGEYIPARDALSRYAKEHFRTTQRVVSPGTL